MKTNKKPLSLEEFHYFYSKVPRFCAEVVVKTPKGIVLTKRAIDPGKGTWHLPGGSVLKDETLEQAALRITEEELGITGKIVKLLGLLQYVKSPHYPGITAFSVVYLIESEQIEDIRLDFQATEFAFFPKELPQNTYPIHEDFLNQHKSAIFD